MTDAVPVDAVHGLLTLLRAQGVGDDLMAWLEPLIEPATAARVMRRFKLDVSVDLSPDAAPRMSLNDTGEPGAFRARVEAAAPHLGLPAPWLAAFFALSAPGDGQTTLGLKLGAPRRATLYFEELTEHSDPDGCRAGVRAMLGLPPGGDGPRLLGAVGVDVEAGATVALKEYRVVDLDEDVLDLAPALRAWADSVPTHARTGRRRAILADRIDPAGGLLGRKLLWMTEARTPAEATTTWRQASDLVRGAGVPVGPNLARALRLARGWRWSASCFPYPDLVSLDVGPDGAPRRAILYVSVK